MAEPITITGKVFVNGGSTNMAAVVGNDGEYITEASISSITYSVYKKVGGESVVDSAYVDVTDSVFDALQLNDMWDADSTGYNFKHVVYQNPDEYAEFERVFHCPNITYVVLYTFVPVDGPEFYVRFEIQSVGV